MLSDSSGTRAAALHLLWVSLKLTTAFATSWVKLQGPTCLVWILDCVLQNAAYGRPDDAGELLWSPSYRNCRCGPGTSTSIAAFTCTWGERGSSIIVLSGCRQGDFEALYGIGGFEEGVIEVLVRRYVMCCGLTGLEHIEAADPAPQNYDSDSFQYRCLSSTSLTFALSL